MQSIYKKINRRYVPIGLYDQEQHYLPNGAHLVIVSDGYTSTRYNISVDDAVVLAAVENLRKAIVEVLYEATELQPKKRAYTQKELQGIAAYTKVAGSPVGLQFEGLSMSEIVQKAMDVLRKELKERGVSCGKIENL